MTPDDKIDAAISRITTAEFAKLEGQIQRLAEMLVVVENNQRVFHNAVASGLNAILSKLNAPGAVSSAASQARIAAIARTLGIPGYDEGYDE